MYVRLAFILGGLEGTNLLLTLLIQWIVITELGVGIETDAFFAGMALPQLILIVVSLSLTHVLVPLLATEDEDTFRRDAWGFFLGIGGLFTGVAAVLFATADYWVPLLFPGFTEEGQALAITLTRIQVVSMVFTAACAVLWSVYHARQRFIWAELSPLLSNVSGLLLLVWLLPLYGIIAAAWITVFRTGLQLVWLLPVLGHWQRPQWRSPTMLKAWRRVKLPLVGTAYYKTDPLVDRLLSSMAPVGGLSLLYVGQQLYSAANQIINKAISAPMVPLLAIQVKAGDWPAFRRSYRKRLLWMGGISSLGYLVLLLFGEPLLSLVIGQGSVTEENVETLWWIMVALGGALIGGAMGQITSTAFYAMGDTRTPTVMSIWTFSFYIPIKFLVFFYSGLIGLAASVSVYFMVNFVVQALLLEKGISLNAGVKHEQPNDHLGKAEK